MEVSHLSGSIVGFPVRGGIIKLNDAEGAVLLRALAGTLKGLSIVGAGALGVSILNSLTPTPTEVKNDPTIAIGAMAKVEPMLPGATPKK